MCETPTKLNNLAATGVLDSACLSCVAGLRASFQPSAPLLGIGARGKVDSVYLEPIDDAQAHSSIWDSWWSSLPTLWAQPVPLNRHPRNKVALLSSGASAQSLWLVSTLLKRFGVEVEYHSLPDESWNWNQLRLKQWMRVRNISRPCALLMIADQALSRKRKFSYPIYDVATMWHRFSGLPTLFALWFNLNSRFDSTSQTRKSLLKWQSLSDTAKGDFLKTRFSQLSSEQIPETLHYMNNLVYELDDEFLRTLDIYKQLLTSPHSELDRGPVALSQSQSSVCHLALPSQKILT